jgi:hypothetical protein
MEQDRAHCIAGFFSDLADAEATRALLSARCLPPERLKLLRGKSSEGPTGSKEAPLSALIRDAVAQGQVVFVADTQNPEETELASEVIQSATHAHRTESKA